MKKNRFDEIEKKYPEIAELIEKTVSEIRALNEKLKSLPKDKGPVPHLKGPGHIPINTQLRQAENTFIYEKAMYEKQEILLEGINKIIAKADPDTQKIAHIYALNRLTRASKGERINKSEKDNSIDSKKSLADRLMGSTPLAQYISAKESITQEIKTFDKFKENSKEINKNSKEIKEPER